MTGRSVAYCFDCKKDLCKPMIKECAEPIAKEHAQLKYWATGKIHATCVMVVTKN